MLDRGVFKPGTTVADRFSTEPIDSDDDHPDLFRAGEVDDIQGCDAIIRFAGGYFALPIRTDATSMQRRRRPQRSPRSSASINDDNELVDILCAYGA